MFAFRLAKELGIWDVDGMLEQMTPTQFFEWAAYFEMDPFGESRADLRSATIASLIANVNRDPKKRKPYEVTDFMPKFGQDRDGGAHAPLTDVEEWKKLRSAVKSTFASPQQR